MATLLIKRGYSVGEVATLTQVPGALLELVQDEQPGQSITQCRPTGPTPRRPPVGIIALSLTVCIYCIWAPQVRHHGTLLGVLTYVTVAIVGAVTVLTARNPGRPIPAADGANPPLPIPLPSARAPQATRRIRRGTRPPS